MSKYEPLETFLRGLDVDEAPMTFAEIERIIGSPLPPAAHAHRAWWSNNPTNNVMTKSWLAAGFVSERVDMASERLVFRRQAPPSAPDAGRGRGVRPPPRGGGLLERVRSRLGGTVRVGEGVDLTAPTGETWDAQT